jgi:hypothetical protein
MDRERARGTEGKKEGERLSFTVRVDDMWAQGGDHVASEDDAWRVRPEACRPYHGSTQFQKLKTNQILPRNYD